MAFEISVNAVTMTAGKDLSAFQYHFVVLASDGKVDDVGSQGANATGILQNDPAADGRAAAVAINGVSKIVCGGSITQGDKLTPGADAQAETAQSGDHVIAQALESGEDNEIIACVLVSAHILA